MPATAPLITWIENRRTIPQLISDEGHRPIEEVRHHNTSFGSEGDRAPFFIHDFNDTSVGVDMIHIGSAWALPSDVANLFTVVIVGDPTLEDFS
jgi:hypothetical protein